MPRATKDAKKDELVDKNKVDNTTKKTTSTTKKKTATANSVKSTTTKKVSKSKTAEKVSSTNKTSKTTKTSSTKKVTKASSSSKVAKTTATKKKSKTSKTTTKSKKIQSNVIAEYYDLPYRYNETIVKILYQTPNILFVYWDISDEDKSKFINTYGENFFNETRPVLRIFNLTKNYNFEVEINDFANSWYIDVNDANCDYKVELGRKPIYHDNNISSDYIYVSSSNNIEFPNDHILLDELPNQINFKNVKTNKVTTKDIGSLRLIGINKIYSVYDFYKKLYKDEVLNEINNNLSSSSWS